MTKERQCMHGAFMFFFSQRLLLIVNKRQIIFKKLNTFLLVCKKLQQMIFLTVQTLKLKLHD